MVNLASNGELFPYTASLAVPDSGLLRSIVSVLVGHVYISRKAGSISDQWKLDSPYPVVSGKVPLYAMTFVLIYTLYRSAVLQTFVTEIQRHLVTLKYRSGSALL